MGADGVSGLIAIKKAGGLSLVQSPCEARFESMPATALAEDHVDAALAIEDLAVALTGLARGEAADVPRPVVSACQPSEPEPRLGSMARSIRVTAGQGSASA